MKKIAYLFLLLMIFQSCNNTFTNQVVSASLKIDSKDSLKLNQVINLNLIEYPGVFLKSEGLEEWQDFKKILNKKNISRKECLLLPFRTISKALKFKL